VVVRQRDHLIVIQLRRRLRVKRRSSARMFAAGVARRLTPADGAATRAGADHLNV
jgi:hypothetical protein